jgi:hypothetical protein
MVSRAVGVAIGSQHQGSRGYVPVLDSPPATGLVGHQLIFERRQVLVDAATV